MNLPFQNRVYDNDVIANPDQPLSAVNTPTSPELINDRLRVDMKALIEIHASKCHDWEDIITMIQSIVFEVYFKKYKRRTKAVKALKISRATFLKWSKL